MSPRTEESFCKWGGPTLDSILDTVGTQNY